MSQEDKPVAWEGAEEWEPLAYALCAEENGEESCNDLIWDGGPIPEPWGERWLKYEYEAKRMIALVRDNAVSQPVAAQEPYCWAGQGLKPLFKDELEALRRREPGMATLYDTPLYANAAPCARCKELETRLQTSSSALVSVDEKLMFAQAKITEQAARIKALEAECDRLAKAASKNYRDNGLAINEEFYAQAATIERQRKVIELAGQLLPKRLDNGFVQFGKYFAEQEDVFNDPYSKMCQFKRQYLTMCQEVLRDIAELEKGVG